MVISELLLIKSSIFSQIILKWSFKFLNLLDDPNSQLRDVPSDNRTVGWVPDISWFVVPVINNLLVPLTQLTIALENVKVGVSSWLSIYT